MFSALMPFFMALEDLSKSKVNFSCPVSRKQQMGLTPVIALFLATLLCLPLK